VAGRVALRQDLLGRFQGCRFDLYLTLYLLDKGLLWSLVSRPVEGPIEHHQLVSLLSTPLNVLRTSRETCRP